MKTKFNSTLWVVMLIVTAHLVACCHNASKNVKSAVNDTASSIVEFTQSGIAYRVIDKDNVNVVEVIPKKGGYSGILVVPENIEYQGNAYSVSGIECYCFNGCVDLLSVSLPNTIDWISEGAFASCSSLFFVDLPGVKHVGALAFANCTALQNVTLPDGVSDISDYAFVGCSALKTINIPKTTTYISSTAFYNCPLLETGFQKTSFNP